MQKRLSLMRLVKTNWSSYMAMMKKYRLIQNQMRLPPPPPPQVYYGCLERREFNFLKNNQKKYNNPRTKIRASCRLKLFIGSGAKIRTKYQIWTRAVSDRRQIRQFGRNEFLSDENTCDINWNLESLTELAGLTNYCNLK